MTQGQPDADTREPEIGIAAPGARERQYVGSQQYVSSQRRARVALAALLIALTIAGIRGANPSVSMHGPLHADGKLLGLALEVAFGGLLIAVLRRRARSPDATRIATALNAMLRAVLVTGLFLVPVSYLLLVKPGQPRRRRLPPAGPARGRTPPPVRHPSGPAAHPGIDIIKWLLLIALLAGIVGCVVLIWRHRPARAARFDAVLEDDVSTDLRRAVTSGQIALREVGEARAAIIACYVAMEESLAQAGAVRAAAETPDELLAKAAAGGLVRGNAAAQLTALFYEARFSTRPLPQAHKAAAQRALAQLLADAAAPVPAGSAPPGSAPPGSARAGTGQEDT
jgi:hypothetical protein